jgi:ATP-dependent protease Clp ATPase subunit
MDCAALLIGAEMQLTQGDRALINQHMAIMCNEGDMERLGAVTLTLLNYIAQFATQSGKNPRGLEQLIDHLMLEIGRM